ncbi:MAG: hypothetical protein GF353_19385 [Candidatus Lokiarchaeota archaeon]|nr:hypothetical protein [Candidatus Lokiarchaeota archaeon]
MTDNKKRSELTKLSENFAERMETAMKKGFISSMILVILEKNPSYGYKIGKTIEENTDSLWNPSASTMYTVLKRLQKRGLIEVKKELDEGRGKKIYEITEKGKNTLKIIMNKHKEMRRVMVKFILTTIADEDLLILKDMLDVDPFNIIFKIRERISTEDKVQFIKHQKKRILGLVELLDNKINQLESHSKQ